MSRSRRPLALRDPAADDNTDENTMSFAGSALPDPPSTLSQSSRRRTRLWNQLQEATNTATADERSVIERDVESEDHSQPLWMRMKRPDSTTLDESMSASRVAPPPGVSRDGGTGESGVAAVPQGSAPFCVQAPVADRPGWCDVQTQAAFFAPHVYSEGTRELVKQLERETEEEIEYLEELVESLQTERDQLKAELEGQAAQAQSAADRCAQLVGLERHLRQQNDELRSVLVLEHTRSEAAEGALKALDGRMDQQLRALADDVSQRTEAMLDTKLRHHAAQIMAAVDSNPAVSALVATNHELRKEVDMLRYENAKQRGEMFNILIEMRRLQSSVTGGGSTRRAPNGSTLEATPMKEGRVDHVKLASRNESSSSEWSTSDDEGQEPTTGTGTGTANGGTSPRDLLPQQHAPQQPQQQHLDPSAAALRPWSPQPRHKPSASA